MFAGNRPPARSSFTAASRNGFGGGGGSRSKGLLLAVVLIVAGIFGECGERNQERQAAAPA